jgi:ferredoxin
MEQEMRIAILGSGPNAFAAYKALEKLNYSVTIIDFALAGMAEDSSLAGLAGKRHNFSSWSMFIPDVFHSRSNLQGNVMGSAAFGGWSNVWGATIFPLTELESSFWNIDSESLREQQRALANKLDLFDLTVDFQHASFDEGILGHINANKNKLTSPNHFQISNLAISKFSDSPTTGCIRCGACLTGCPYGHIWNSRDGWGDIKETKNLKFEWGIWVKELNEVGGQVVLKGVRNGDTHEYCFDKVFIALGAYQTAALMIRSKICEKVVIKDSPMVVIPFFLPFFRKTTPSRPGVTLASAFASSTFLTGKSQPLVHDFFAQIYGHSDDIEDRILGQAPILRGLPKFLRNIFFSRIGIAMCFFDESFGGVIHVELNSNSEVEFSPKNYHDNRIRLINIARKNLWKFKLRTLPFFGFLTQVGMGYHSGASFPHRVEALESSENYSDYVGRPNGYTNIHLVDMSVFPRIGSSPPTFNSMVNAHRIVEETLSCCS